MVSSPDIMHTIPLDIIFRTRTLTCEFGLRRSIAEIVLNEYTAPPVHQNRPN